jgi:energy-coupling factor transporter ATP-binding protein EcfA2
MGGPVPGIAKTMNDAPLVIIGPSGSGKSSVVKILCEQYGYTLMKTVTTRPRRDEFDTDHTFISLEEFATRKQNNEFIGILEVFGAKYGLPRFNPKDKILLLLRAPALPELLGRFPQARQTLDRFDPEMLTKEMALGASFAQAIFDSSILSSEEIAQAIAALG